LESSIMHSPIAAMPVRAMDFAPWNTDAPEPGGKPLFGPAIVVSGEMVGQVAANVTQSGPILKRKKRR
jgi:hypothetical protein